MGEGLVIDLVQELKGFDLVTPEESSVCRDGPSKRGVLFDQGTEGGYRRPGVVVFPQSYFEHRDLPLVRDSLPLPLPALLDAFMDKVDGSLKFVEVAIVIVIKFFIVAHEVANEIVVYFFVIYSYGVPVFVLGVGEGDGEVFGYGVACFVHRPRGDPEGGYVVSEN